MKYPILIFLAFMLAISCTDELDDFSIPESTILQEQKSLTSGPAELSKRYCDDSPVWQVHEDGAPWEAFCNCLDLDQVDINGDGILSSIDIFLLNHFLVTYGGSDGVFDSSDNPNLIAIGPTYDYNGDGTINIADIQYMLANISYASSSFQDPAFELTCDDILCLQFRIVGYAPICED